VAEENLDGAQVGAGLQQTGRKAVTKGTLGDIPTYVKSLRQFFPMVVIDHSGGNRTAGALVNPFKYKSCDWRGTCP
jgi:hypothetical protein